jgi:hypothetical protein
MTIESYKTLFLDNMRSCTMRALYGDESVTEEDLYMLSIILWLIDQQEWYTLEEDKRLGLERSLETIILRNGSITPGTIEISTYKDVNITSMLDMKPVQYTVDPGTITPVMDFFIGVIPFESVHTLTYNHIASLAQSTPLQKPLTTYVHSSGSLYGYSQVIAFPKVWGSLTGVTDQHGVSIIGAYEWTERMLTIPGVGNVLYVIGGAKRKMMYNDSTHVCWSIA